MFDFNDADPQIIPFSSYASQPAWLRSEGAVTETQRLIVGNEANLLQALGIDPYLRKHQTCPMPARHKNGADLNPSFRFDLARGKFYCTCEPRGGDILDIVEHTGHAHDKISACNWVRDQLGYPRVGEARQETQQQREERERRLAEQRTRAEEISRQREEEEAARVEEQLQKARALWWKSVPAVGTAVPSYLASRGITCKFAETVRYLPRRDDKSPQCMVVPFGASLSVRGVHLTYIRDDGMGYAEDRHGLKKRTIGIGENFPPLIVATVENCDRLFVSEGIEDALSAHQAIGCSAWAAGSAARLPGLAGYIPAHIKTVIIQQDDNGNGRSGTVRLANALSEKGICVMISEGKGDVDVNSILMASGDGAVREYLAAAKPYDTSKPQLTVVSVASPTQADIESLIDGLDPASDQLEISKVISMIARARLDPLIEQHVVSRIKQQCELPMSALRDQIKVLKKRLGGPNATSQAAWQSQIRRNMFGQPERNEANAIIAFKNDLAFADAIIFDEFRQEILVTKPMPWEIGNKFPREWREVDDIRGAEWLQRNDINVNPSVVSRTVQAIASENAVHPVREYLEKLQWDGVSRLRDWVANYLGAEPTGVHSAYGELWMISAVARIMKPGCKVDCALILEGPQGARKSSALKALAGSEWFTDELAEVGSKDAAMQVRGVWLIEIAELDAVSKADVNKIKAFLSRAVDRYRPAYGRYVIDVPRQCVFAGSVNMDTYLRDDTGNRRFWSVRCGTIDIAAIERDRDQLWAEAVAAYQCGAIWWLDDPVMIAAAKDHQADRLQGDVWDEHIAHWIAIDPRTDMARRTPLESVSVGEILKEAFNIDPNSWTRSDEMRVSSFLTRNGWERHRVSFDGKRPWRYRRAVPT